MKDRTKKGKFRKGGKGGPGRKKTSTGEVPTSQAIRDAFYKAFVELFVKSGDPKKLVEFCKKNQMNQRLLIQEVRKILPDIITQAEQEKKMRFEFSEDYVPKLSMKDMKESLRKTSVLNIKRTITDKRTDVIPEIEKREELPLENVPIEDVIEEANEPVCPSTAGKKKEKKKSKDEQLEPLTEAQISNIMQDKPRSVPLISTQGDGWEN